MNPTSNQLKELEDITKRRWLERTELNKAKREKDILATQKRLTFKPIPLGSFERLPDNQIWEKILPYLTIQSDIRTAYSACPTFQTLLEHENTTLTEVFKILRDNKYLGNTSLAGQLKGFVKRQVLTLRLVSKHWKKSAEQVFMNDFVGDWHLDFHGKLAGCWIFYPGIINFFSLEQIRRAMLVLKQSQSKPALVGTIHINEAGLGINGVSKITDFLMDHGGSVQALLIRWKDGTLITERYQTLLCWVKHTPNLKALVMHSTSQIGSVPPNTLTNFLEQEQHRFPTIPSLELIRFEDYENDALTLEILEKSCNLKSIKLPSNIQFFDEVMTATLNKLKLVEHYYATQKDTIRCNLLISLTWPLRKITIESSVSENFNFFPILNRFWRTLEHLHLGGISGHTVRERLKLPHLKTLKILKLTSGTSLDFIEPLESLELIEIDEYNVTSQCSTSEHLHLSLCPGALEQSKIWRYFPYLQNIRIKRMTYPNGIKFKRK